MMKKRDLMNMADQTEALLERQRMKKRYKVNKYTFYKVDPSHLSRHQSKRAGVYEDALPKYHSLFIGQLLALFGDADYVFEDNECLCTFAVAAEDKDGSIKYLEAYYGPSGPAIGGSDRAIDDVMDAVNELVELIKRAKPKDFEYRSVYGDLGAYIKMGVKNGEPYYVWNVP